MNRPGGVLIAVLMTSMILGVSLYRGVESQKKMTRRLQCVGHLKRVALALHNYHSTFDSFPPGTIPNSALPPERRLSWVVAAWPFLSTSDELQVETEKAWDDESNLPPKLVLLPHRKDVIPQSHDHALWAACPADPAYQDRVRPLALTYVGIAGVGLDAPRLASKHPRAGIFGFDRVTRIDEITDGTIGTSMLIETTVGHRPWTAGGPSSVRGVDPAARPSIGRGRPFGGYHAGGANVAMADGSIRFVRETVDPKVFEALATIAGGETITEEFDR